MSHFTKVQAEIRDLNALKKALSNMNLQLTHNTSCRYFFGSQIKENVVKLPSPSQYDMALEPNGDGSYNIVADFYPSGNVARVIGERGSILLRQYAIEKLRIEATKIGCKVYGSGGKLKVTDSQNPSAKLEATIGENGEISFKASGFKGKGCMKFQKLEEAMGTVSNMKFTSEYYEPEEKEGQKLRY